MAAPTAGLHFTTKLLDEIASMGVERTTITLHVGYGTFKPVRVERVEDHEVDPERYSVDPEAAEDADEGRSGWPSDRRRRDDDDACAGITAGGGWDRGAR